MVSKHSSRYSLCTLRFHPLRPSFAIAVTRRSACIEDPAVQVASSWLARRLDAVGDVDASFPRPAYVPPVPLFSPLSSAPRFTLGDFALSSGLAWSPLSAVPLSPSSRSIGLLGPPWFSRPVPLCFPDPDPLACLRPPLPTLVYARALGSSVPPCPPPFPPHRV